MGEYYKVVQEELRTVEQKPRVFVFMGWENEIARVKGTDAKGIVMQLLAELEEYATLMG